MLHIGGDIKTQNVYANKWAAYMCTCPHADMCAQARIVIVRMVKPTYQKIKPAPLSSKIRNLFLSGQINFLCHQVQTSDLFI